MGIKVLIILVLLLMSQPLWAFNVEHRLAVHLNLANAHIEVRDELIIHDDKTAKEHASIADLKSTVQGQVQNKKQGKKQDETKRYYRFYLHRNLTPKLNKEVNSSVKIIPFGNLPQDLQQAFDAHQESEDKTYRQYLLQLPKDLATVRLSYAGRIFHQLSNQAVEQQGGIRDSRGLISEQGVFLARSSFWYPYFLGEELVDFNLRVTFDEHYADTWQSVSQGEQIARNHWRAKNQDEIYLIAGDYEQIEKDCHANTKCQVFLKRGAKDVQQLAERYLQATNTYLKGYEKLLGAYPFKKFALVENFWESGFGMPSFTLLGSRVIRFPFILKSSYPHEIVHNWWGNSVFIDFSKGNWAEGLTTYLSDHLIQAQAGKGASYRQQLLQKYRDYSVSGKDFALQDFIGRHNSLSSAVGYGKSLMVFHMLRISLGDEAFISFIKSLYAEYQYRYLSWPQIKQFLIRFIEKNPNAYPHLEATFLDAFFKQWLSRIGAPKLVLEKVKHSPDEHKLELSLGQQGIDKAYWLKVPLYLSYWNQQSNQTQSILKLVDMPSKQLKLDVALEPNLGELIALDVDPNFDLFRQIDNKETPIALSHLLASTKVLLVWDEHKELATNQPTKDQYRQMASEVLQARGAKKTIEFKLASELKKSDLKHNIILLGDNAGVLKRFPKLKTLLAGQLQEGKIKLANKALDINNRSIFFIHSNPYADDKAIAFLRVDNAKAMRALTRKLPHYHKYSYLSFYSARAQNEVKGRWQVSESPLSWRSELLSTRSELLSTRSELLSTRSGQISSRSKQEQDNIKYSIPQAKPLIRF